MHSMLGRIRGSLHHQTSAPLSPHPTMFCFPARAASAAPLPLWLCHTFLMLPSAAAPANCFHCCLTQLDIRAAWCQNLSSTREANGEREEGNTTG